MGTNLQIGKIPISFIQPPPLPVGVLSPVSFYLCPSHRLLLFLPSFSCSGRRRGRAKRGGAPPVSPYSPIRLHITEQHPLAAAPSYLLDLPPHPTPLLRRILHLRPPPSIPPPLDAPPSPLPSVPPRSSLLHRAAPYSPCSSTPTSHAPSAALSIAPPPPFSTSRAVAPSSPPLAPPSSPSPRRSSSRSASAPPSSTLSDRHPAFFTGISLIADRCFHFTDADLCLDITTSSASRLLQPLLPRLTFLISLYFFSKL